MNCSESFFDTTRDTTTVNLSTVGHTYHSTYYEYDVAIHNAYLNDEVLNCIFRHLKITNIVYSTKRIILSNTTCYMLLIYIVNTKCNQPLITWMIFKFCIMVLLKIVILGIDYVCIIVMKQVRSIR